MWREKEREAQNSKEYGQDRMAAGPQDCNLAYGNFRISAPPDLWEAIAVHALTVEPNSYCRC